jgi:hypothetical protein
VELQIIETEFACLHITFGHIRYGKFAFWNVNITLFVLSATETSCFVVSLSIGSEFCTIFSPAKAIPSAQAAK